MLVDCLGHFDWSAGAPDRAGRDVALELAWPCALGISVRIVAGTRPPDQVHIGGLGHAINERAHGIDDTSQVLDLVVLSFLICAHTCISLKTINMTSSFDHTAMKLYVVSSYDGSIV